ncbi:MAG TPA: hypothetical protein VKU02_17015 [Gemmataceae bacterium]|nr:hypothetical protein [Gemmataceae bacterium]
MKRFAFALSVFAGISALMGAEPIQLVSDADHARYMQYLPKTNDPWLNALKKSKLVFYTEVEVPRAYQLGGGVHSSYYNISAAQPLEPFGNATREFPWGAPAGTDLSENATSIKFVVFPEAGQPIRWWQEYSPYERGNPVYRWVYPVGTVFGEILIVRGPDGYGRTFELRVRQREEAGWRPRVFRPFRTATELDRKVRDLRPDWRDDAALRQFLQRDDRPVTRIRDQHPLRVFDRTAVEDPLPPLPVEMVDQLLAEPFQDVSGETWVATVDGKGYAPTTESSFSIVPRNYAGSHVPMTAKACMQCHETSGMHTTQIGPLGRDWYGFAAGGGPGGGEIFSFHIFDPSCISYNGFVQGVRLRSELLQAGLLRRWDE